MYQIKVSLLSSWLLRAIALINHPVLPAHAASHWDCHSVHPWIKGFIPSSSKLWSPPFCDSLAYSPTLLGALGRDVWSASAKKWSSQSQGLHLGVSRVLQRALCCACRERCNMSTKCPKSVNFTPNLLSKIVANYWGQQTYTTHFCPAWFHPLDGEHPSEPHALNSPQQSSTAAFLSSLQLSA